MRSGALSHDAHFCPFVRFSSITTHNLNHLNSLLYIMRQPFGLVIYLQSAVQYQFLFSFSDGSGHLMRYLTTLQVTATTHMHRTLHKRNFAFTFCTDSPHLLPGTDDHIVKDHDAW